ncbi:MAG: ABC transporter permease [Phaeodactylibacter sp.]|nr:ABC transporter permease [Phaeodactylibacter sp.]
MWKNYLKTALRDISRNKLYSTINILGLAIGLAVCFLIFVWVRDELRYDRFHANADRIYRVLWEARYGENEWKIPLGPVPVAGALEREFPEVEKTAQLYKGGFTVKQGREFVREPNVLFVDKGFFDVFSLEFVDGSPEGALEQPDAILVTEEAAARYFGERSPVGHHLEGNDGALYQVSGVVKAFPRQSHLQFDFLAPLKSLPHIEQRAGQWGSAAVYNYFLLRRDANPEAIQKKWQAYIEENVAGETFRQGNNFTRFPFQALTDIHLRSHLEYELSPNGNISYVYIFSVVAVFILLLACINFINLATARSLERSREVGVRKVLGSGRGQLFWQFFGEAFLYVALAVGLSLVLVWAALPWFNQLTGKELMLNFLQSPFLWLLLAGLMVLAALLSGALPALLMASFQPVKALKGQLVESVGRGWLRKGLVVSQFCISTVLIVGALAVSNQLSFLQSRRLGFDKEQVIVLNRAQALGKQYGAFFGQLQGLPGVESASAAQFLPGKEFDSTVFEPEQPSNYKETSLSYAFIDPHFVETLQLELAAGRNFTAEMATDSTAALINEAAARKLGWDEPLGKKISMGRQRPFQVVGVVKDFHFRSLHHEIEPIVLMMTPWNLPYIAVRLQPGDVEAHLQSIRAAWREFAPDTPFDYSFLSEDYAQLYDSERRMGQVFAVFSALAVFIACLGLFGLAAFMAVRRTREIGIRKVLGASVLGIVGLLSRDFLRLVLVALLVAVPIAWYGMNKWLQGFAYRAELEWWVFALAGGIAVAMAFLTVAYQSFKAAMGNPVEALKVE